MALSLEGKIQLLMTAYFTSLVRKAKAASQISFNCCDEMSVIRKLFELGPGGKPNIQFNILDRNTGSQVNRKREAYT